MEIQHNVPLSSHTTLRAGGPADHLCIAHTVDDIRRAVLFMREQNLPFFVLGGGSNVLFSDDGYSGLVIKPELFGVEWGREEESGQVEVVTCAGEEWDAFVASTVSRGLFGLENLSYIPGTVGASPVQNIGAYGTEVSEVIAWVEAFDVRSNEVKIFSNEACAFSYRNSFFKTEEGKNFIITRVAFRLHTSGEVNTSYKDVEKYFSERKITSPSLSDVRNAVVFIRKNKLPDPKHIGTAGSFFKNPILSSEEFSVFAERFPDAPFYQVGQGLFKVPAGWLIDHVCGLRGVRNGDVGSYEKQALAIVNYGNAHASEIRDFSEHVRACVKERTNIMLEYEVLLM